MHRAQVIGHDLEFGGGPDRAGVQDLAAEDLQHGQHLLEGLATTAGEDRDVARVGTMAAPGHRAVHRHAALGGDQGADAHDFCLVGSAHFEPDFASREAGQHAVRALQDRA